MKALVLRKTLVWMLVFGLFGVVIVAGLHLYLRSNLSASERISTDVGLLHENLETALTVVNTQQSIITEAASTLHLDPRALGAAIVARRALKTQPILTETRALAGLTENVGFAHICVSSTEAAFRVVFAPSAADSLLYYLPAKTLYDEARTALAPYRSLHGHDLRNALQQNPQLNILAAALVLKQALVRFERENALSITPLSATALAGALYHDAADYPFPNDTPITTTQEADNFGQLVSLIYTRSDLMP
jgi:hypothetical protein